MPLYDFKCTECGKVFERLERIECDTVTCSCGASARRIISSTGVFTANEDAPWLKSVLDVVDRSNPAPHVQEFVRNPTRRNYKAWMKGEGLRPADHTEHGGPPVFKKPPEPDLSKVTDFVARRHFERKKLEIRS